MFRIGFVLGYGDSVRESWSGGATSERRALYLGLTISVLCCICFEARRVNHVHLRHRNFES